MSVKIIDAYCSLEGWHSIPDPLGEWETLEDALKSDDWDLFDFFGDERDPVCQVYQHHIPDKEDFLVSYNTLYSWRIVYAPNFPSLLQLMEKMSAMVGLRTTSRFLEMAEGLRELLVEYQCGPLEEPLMAKCRQERERREKRARQKEADKKKVGTV